jgi:hypothetical protein
MYDRHPEFVKICSRYAQVTSNHLMEVEQQAHAHGHRG